MEQFDKIVQWFVSNMSNIGTIATILAFVVSIVVLAFSAYRYVTIRRDELKDKRYGKYHQLIRDISTGSDGGGPLKLASQRAYLYELRHFPEYRVLTRRVLSSFVEEWGGETDNKSTILRFEIQDTLNALRGSWPCRQEKVAFVTVGGVKAGK